VEAPAEDEGPRGGGGGREEAAVETDPVAMLVEEEEPRLEERIEAAPTLEREGLKVADLCGWTRMQGERREKKEEKRKRRKTSAKLDSISNWTVLDSTKKRRKQKKVSIIARWAENSPGRINCRIYKEHSVLLVHQNTSS